jgi:hypothetical protein
MVLWQVSPGMAYSLAIAVVERLQLDDVWVPDNAHDLQLSVL